MRTFVFALGCGIASVLGHKILSPELVAPPTPQQDTLYNGYIAQCVNHLKSVTAQIDAAYSDVQTTDVLENECKVAKEHNNAIEDGFRSSGACRHFAEEVTKARRQAMNNGGEGGYVSVCENYVKHFVPATPAPVVEAAPEHPVDWGVTMGVFFLALILVFIVSLYNKHTH